MNSAAAFADRDGVFETFEEKLRATTEPGDKDAIRLAVEFCRFVSRFADPAPTMELLVAAALASLRVSESHSCAALGEFLEARRRARSEDAGESEGSRPQKIGFEEALRACIEGDPTLEDWMRALRDFTSIVGPPPDGSHAPKTPLVLAPGGLLYLARYWAYERDVAADLRRRALRTIEVDDEALEAALEEVFSPSPESPTPLPSPDLQRVAGAVAATRSLSILSGGPGTGKTSAVVRILATLARLQLRKGGSGLSIGLAAPTGKAAARMKEAIEKTRGELPVDLQRFVPDEASTIHRLLGYRSDSIYFRHDEDRKLPYDVLVVDEASMVALPLMAKMLRALRDDARLLLVGDKDQLASVEAGSVLGDICSSHPGFDEEARSRIARLSREKNLPPLGNAAVDGPLRNSIVILRHNFRFPAESGIRRLAEAVRLGEVVALTELFQQSGSSPGDGDRPDIDFVAIEDEKALRKQLRETVPGGYGDYLSLACKGVEDGLFKAFNRFRILCAVRQGDFGVERVNRSVAEILEDERLIRRHGEWYAGRPVMVTRNDYSLNLFNGAVGITLAQGGRPRVRFEDDARAGASLPTARLPAHETVYAMTIHKSQGSEFDDVVVVLPPDDSRILSRELLYTAITRAKKRVVLWGSRKSLEAAITTTLARSSGLADALWSPVTP